MPESISLALRLSKAEPSAIDFGAGRIVPAKEVGVAPLTGRDCEISGVEELEETGRPRPSFSRSEAFVGGEEPSGDGLNGDRELGWRDIGLARLASEILFLVPRLGGLAAGSLVMAAFAAADLAAATGLALVGFAVNGFGATGLVVTGFAAADFGVIAFVVTGFLAIAGLTATAVVVGCAFVFLESCPSGVLVVVAEILAVPFVGGFDVVGPVELDAGIPLAFVGALSTSSISSSDS